MDLIDVNGGKKRALGIIRDVPVATEHSSEVYLDLQVSDATTYDVILGNDWLKKVNALINIAEEYILIQDKDKDNVIKEHISIYKEAGPVYIEGDEEFKEQLVYEKTVYYKHDDTPSVIQKRLYEKQNFYDVGPDWQKPTLPTEFDELSVKEQVKEVHKNNPHIRNLVEEQKEQLYTFLHNWKHMFAYEAADLGETDIYLHTIPTNETHKVYHRPRKYSRRQLRFIREEVQKLLKAGVIQKSKSPWGFPPVIVDKKNGSQRLCIDYRKLNDVTIRDSYPLPNIAETLDSFHGAKYFSTLDLTSGYWQMKIHPKDRAKTAFNTRHGHFEFVRMPFGLTNAPASFQRLMDRVLEQEIGDFVQVYLDDIIIYSETWEEHLIHLNKVLERLEKAGLKLSKEKCKFGETELEFLGHIISRDGIKPDPKKIEKIKNWPTPEGPKRVKKVRGFLGLASYYRRFIQDFSKIAKPLSKLTSKNVKWEWGPEQEKAMNELKTRIINDVVMKHPDFSKPFILQTDASATGMGAVLSQIDENDQRRPIAFASRTLVGAEPRYGAPELELGAIHWALMKVFRQYLLEHPFTLETDHQAIKGLFKSDEGSPRIKRWRLDLQQYYPDMEVVYIPGVKQGNVDSLSRMNDGIDRIHDMRPESRKTTIQS